MGRDLQLLDTNHMNISFNPRARVGRDRALRQRQRLYRGFNPRARVGRDALAMQLNWVILVVSIHAPAWGATYNERFLGGVR